MSSHSPHWNWPWQDRKGNLLPAKAITFALMFYPALWALYHVSVGGFGPLVLVGLIYWSGVWATALLLLTLAVTPAARIFGWKRLVPARRIIGVSALIHTVAHVIIYLALYKWDFAFLIRDMATRLTLIVATASTIGLAALGATSFDAAVRWMNGRNWKRLHRTNYVLTGLAIVHFLLSPGIFSMQYLMAGVFFWLMAWRWLARYGRGNEPGLLLGLALASCLFTGLLEAEWMWAYHGVDPWQTLGDNFSLIVGVSAAWRVLALGLVVAVAAAFLGRRQPAHSL